MRPLSIAGTIGATAAAVAMLTAPMPSAYGAPCPDAEVVFARGTTEAPGVGPTGEAFVDSLRTRVAPKSLGVYAVNYPAAMDFDTAVDGIADARAHILATVANCPQTKLVLGGFSQGAAVMGFVTADVVPDGVSPDTVPAPMPPEIADHVSAVALFGKPSPRFMRAIRDPEIVVGPRYVDRAVDLCVDNDLVCDPHGSSFSVHDKYSQLGMVDQGVVFVANHLQTAWAADAAAAAADPAEAAAVPADVPATATPHLAPEPLEPGPTPVAPPPVRHGPVAPLA